MEGNDNHFFGFSGERGVRSAASYLLHSKDSLHWKNREKYTASHLLTLLGSGGKASLPIKQVERISGRGGKIHQVHVYGEVEKNTKASVGSEWDVRCINLRSKKRVQTFRQCWSDHVLDEQIQLLQQRAFFLRGWNRTKHKQTCLRLGWVQRYTSRNTRECPYVEGRHLDGCVKTLPTPQKLPRRKCLKHRRTIINWSALLFLTTCENQRVPRRWFLYREQRPLQGRTIERRMYDTRMGQLWKELYVPTAMKSVLRTNLKYGDSKDFGGWTISGKRYKNKVELNNKYRKHPGV